MKYEITDTQLKSELIRKRKEFNYWFNNSYDESFITENLNINDLKLDLSLVLREYVVPVGCIDILCEDSNKNRVPIEIKKNMAGDGAIGQILGYMKAVDSRYGIIIAKKFSKRLIYIANDYNIKLFYYTINKIGDEYDNESKCNQFIIGLKLYENESTNDV